MYIIKNRVSGEYDQKGIGAVFCKVKRSAWDKISHAKCHVTNTLDCGSSSRFNRIFNWYMDADFIEISEDGVGVVIPVREYLHEYYKNSYKIRKLTQEQKDQLKLGDVIL